jgi:L-aspartate oxidase
MFDVDYLIIGSGLAGLNAALLLSEHGQVLVVTKRQIADSATAWAQGGIAGVLPEPESFDEHSADTFDAHVRDTLIAGAGLCHENVVREVVSDAPQAIERLVKLGVTFDKQGKTFHLTREAGHSARRILHSQDLTGREIMRALQAQCETNTRIRFLTDHIAVDLITLRKLGVSAHDRCLGAYALNTKSGDVVTLRAKATLLATGGSGKVYLYTSNPDIATGDGVAMAFRAGAAIANMEFFQFHPTCLYNPKAKSFLISEALRGEGGVLRNINGTPFMAALHPQADLAPRDIVARAIDQQMKRSGDDYVLLDMTAFDPTFIHKRFPNIHAACLELGIDMTQNPIPVVPAAHYQCGGVRTDMQARTDVPGLWAAGEVGCTGLHGANRLASNSLLEAAVMSNRAAQDMVAFGAELSLDVVVPEWDSGNAADPDEMVVVSHNWDELRRAMWSYVGIVRSDRRLQRALERISMLQEEIREYYWDFKLTSDLVEMRNLLTTAHLIVECAQHRRESRGLHYNLNTPEANDTWRHDTIVRKGVHHKLHWEDRDAT